MEKRNELRRKIRNKEKQELVNDFEMLFKSLDLTLDMDKQLRARMFVYQIRDYILEEAE